MTAKAAKRAAQKNRKIARQSRAATPRNGRPKASDGEVRNETSVTKAQKVTPSVTAKPAEPVTPKLTPGRAVVGTGLMSLLAVAALGITRFVHSSLVSHHLDDPGRYGTVGLMISVATIASLALPAGVASAMVRFIPFHIGAGAPATARSMYRFLTRIGLASSVVLGLGAALLTPLFVTMTVADAVLVGLLTFTFSVYSFDKNAMYGFDRVSAYVRLELSTSVLTIATTVALLMTELQLYVLPLALGYTVFVVVSRLLLRKDTRGEAAPKGAFDRGEVWFFIVIASLGTLSSTGFLWGTNSLARVLTVEAASGYYFAATALLTPMNLLPRALNMALFPAMAQAQGAGDTEAVRRHSDVSTRALFVILAPLFAAALPLAPLALLIFNGPKFVVGGPILQVMLAATFLSVVQVASVNALSAGTSKQFRIPATSAMCGAVIGIAAAALLTPWLGPLGVAFGYLIGTAVIAGGPIVITWRLHGMAWGGMIVRSLVVVAISSVVSIALARVGLIGGFGGTLSAVGAAIGSLAVGVAVLWRDLRSLLVLARNRGRLAP